MIVAFLIGLVVGAIVALAAVMIMLHVVEPLAKGTLFPKSPKLPKGVRRTDRPDVRRVVLRPVNKDEPPSRVTQALYQHGPTRRLRDENDARDID